MEVLKLRRGQLGSGDQKVDGRRGIVATGPFLRAGMRGREGGLVGRAVLWLTTTTTTLAQELHGRY